MANLIAPAYRYFLKPLLFQFDPEAVHNGFTAIGNRLGHYSATRSLTKHLLNYSHPYLEQTIAGIHFQNPVGLSAGFDYDGKMSGILPSVGFGFASVGTVTHRPYPGNPKPRLTRLPLTQSILVNKGFKSAGIQAVLDRYLVKPNPQFILGLSLGATNSPQTSEPKTQMPDILEAFKVTRKHPKYSLLDYLELNISCPNVMGAGTLATPQHLSQLLTQIDRLKLNKPLWIKFPIHVTDPEAIELVNIMVRHHVAAVVIGNLYKKRDPKIINPSELAVVAKLSGNFSGKPTEKLSNHLISLVFRHFRQKITIVGVGGIFSAEDAYTKIKRGASLVQLITGMIYLGPQLIGTINHDLVSLLKADGYTSIGQAVGSQAKSP